MGKGAVSGQSLNLRMLAVLAYSLLDETNACSTAVELMLSTVCIFASASQSLSDLWDA